MNYAAGVLVIGGGLAVVIAVRGSYKAIYAAMSPASQTATPASAKSFTDNAYPQPSGTPPASTDTSGQAKNYWWELARRDAALAGIDSTFFSLQIRQESGFNPLARSPAGALGIAQFMPATASGLGIDPLNPVQALYGASKYMKSLLDQFGGNEPKALAAYNWGTGNVQSDISTYGTNWWQHIPTETYNYINSISGLNAGSGYA